MTEPGQVRMPWSNDREARRRSDATYGARWRKARQRALERARWKCEARLDGCTGAATEVDHVLGAQADPEHTTLRAVCSPCHRKITAQQGGGFRSGGRGGADPEPHPRTSW
jgi:5-methylcytosine-specific restriction enzyme A